MMFPCDLLYFYGRYPDLLEIVATTTYTFVQHTSKEPTGAGKSELDYGQTWLRAQRSDKKRADSGFETEIHGSGVGTYYVMCGSPVS